MAELLRFKNVKTVKDAVKWHLQQHGSITSWEAITEYGAPRLSAIIFNLQKEGMTFTKKGEKHPNKFGRKVSVTRYVLN